jgi:2-polyprenyl-6-methoxyphenol hydroxylase-like FAD-dependent oxidoreductase
MGTLHHTSTTCAVVGGGPAGMMLGLLLARSGVDVAVLEQYPDFLRDFRGDTIHASTLALLDELGLGERFAALPQQREPHVTMTFDDGDLTEDFTRLPGRHQHVALVPQWDFLNLLADAGAASGRFHLAQNAEATGLIRDGGTVTGLHYLDKDTGRTHRLDADLVIAADGRHSTVRALLGWEPASTAAPHDCLYVRIPREDTDPEHTYLRFSSAGGLIMINRGDYWQVGLLIGRGQADLARADEGRRTRETIAALAPSFAARTAGIRADDIAALQIRIDRLSRWWAPGILLIGDAAHAMSPIGGVGINLAIQDAVAAARVLAPTLLHGTTTVKDLARVQRRRWRPTVLTQAMQRAAQKQFVAASMEAHSGQAPPLRIPQPLRTLRHLPGFAHLYGRLIALGIRPEHLTGPLAPLNHLAEGHSRV